MSSFDFNRFEVEVMEATDWYNDFYRINIKVHDRFGYFGAERFDYFVCSNKEEIRTKGCSKAYIMIQNMRSLKYLKGELSSKIARAMKDKFGIYVEDVIDKDLVIYAYDKDPSVVVGRSGLTMFFPDLRNNSEQASSNKGE